uniref:Secreted protein n=1 Tax=Ixodes ricinus TaxID=34613 RepID=A0A6B0UIN8_IXORI
MSDYPCSSRWNPRNFIVLCGLSWVSFGLSSKPQVSRSVTKCRVSAERKSASRCASKMLSRWAEAQRLLHLRRRARAVESCCTTNGPGLNLKGRTNARCAIRSCRLI